MPKKLNVEQKYRNHEEVCGLYRTEAKTGKVSFSFCFRKIKKKLK